MPKSVDKILSNCSEDLFPCLTESNDFTLRRSQRLLRLRTPTSQQSIQLDMKHIDCDAASETSTLDFNMILEDINQNYHLPLDLSKIVVEKQNDENQATKSNTIDNPKNSQKEKIPKVEEVLESSSKKLNSECLPISLTKYNANDNQKISQKIKLSNVDEVEEIARKKFKIDPTIENQNNHEQSEIPAVITKPKKIGKARRVNCTTGKNATQTKNKTRGRRKMKISVRNSKQNKILPSVDYVPPKVIRYNTCPAQTATVPNSFELPSTGQSLLPAIYPPHFTQQLVMIPNVQTETNCSPMPITYPTPENSQFMKMENSPTTPTLSIDSLQDFFDMDELCSILNMEQIIYRLTESHVHKLAELLDKDVGELFSLLDKIIELDQDQLNELKKSTVLNDDTLRNKVQPAQ